MDSPRPPGSDTTQIDLRAVKEGRNPMNTNSSRSAIGLLAVALLLGLPVALIVLRTAGVQVSGGAAESTSAGAAEMDGQGTSNGLGPVERAPDRVIEPSVLARRLGLEAPPPIDDPVGLEEGPPLDPPGFVGEAAPQAPVQGRPLGVERARPLDQEAEERERLRQRGHRPPLARRIAERGGERRGIEPAEPEWVRLIREQMEKRISFDFVDTPLADVFAFLTNLTGINYVLDPQSIQDDDRPVTLKVNDMRIGAALEWILRLVNLNYDFKDEVIFIATRERLHEPVGTLVYDCRDILKEEAREELLDVIFGLVEEGWHDERAVLRFIDGRLIVRHRKNSLKVVEEFMDAFMKASEMDPLPVLEEEGEDE